MISTIPKLVLILRIVSLNCPRYFIAPEIITNIISAALAYSSENVHIFSQD
jgi:hypothetical protein